VSFCSCGIEIIMAEPPHQRNDNHSLCLNLGCLWLPTSVASYIHSLCRPTSRLRRQCALWGSLSYWEFAECTAGCSDLARKSEVMCTQSYHLWQRRTSCGWYHFSLPLQLQSAVCNSEGNCSNIMVKPTTSGPRKSGPFGE
jgi:hypothetical protein